MFLRNVGIYLRVYTAPKPKITSSQIKGITKQRSEENIWTQEAGTGEWRKLHNEELITFTSH
jgi:hypothetical protein